MSSSFGLRDILKTISPPWKRVDFFEKLDYAMSIVLDAIVDKVDQAVAARIPTRTKTVTSLPLIGTDRLIPQGVSESTTSYAVRLQHAYDSWALAGTARAVLQQILGYISPATPRIMGVNNTSAWDVLLAGAGINAVPAHTFVFPANWNWDFVSDPHHSTRWFRVWLIIDATGWTASAPSYGARALGAAGSTYGLASTATFLQQMLPIIALWKYAGAVVSHVIVRTDLANPMFDPAAAFGAATLPDGRWGHWSKIVAGVRVAARSDKARYIDGVA